MAVHAAVLILPGTEFAPRPGPAPATVVKVTLAVAQNEPAGAKKPVSRERRLRPAPRPERVIAQAAPREEPVPEAIANQSPVIQSMAENPAPHAPAPAAAPETPVRLATVPTARASEPDDVVRFLHNPPPQYPWQARRMGIEGRVVLNVEILQNGNAGRIAIRQSSGHELLDQAAIRAVSSWRFDPARAAGTPITAWADVPISFRLTEP